MNTACTEAQWLAISYLLKEVRAETGDSTIPSWTVNSKSWMSRRSHPDLIEASLVHNDVIIQFNVNSKGDYDLKFGRVQWETQERI